MLEQDKKHAFEIEMPISSNLNIKQNNYHEISLC